eukprot:Pgem_evm1s5245
MHKQQEISASAIADSTKVFVNGNWVGIHSEPNELVSTLRKVRRRKNISHEVSVVHMIRERELRLCTDAGRVSRPLFVVREDQKLEIQKADVYKIDPVNFDGPGEQPATFEFLLERGVLEYIDVSEEETCMISMFIDDLGKSICETYTHCEIHPSMILGVCASIIPFPDHNQ